MEQRPNKVLYGEYVGPGKIITGTLLKGTYIDDSEEPINPVRTGLVLKIVKSPDSTIKSIQCLDSDTREVIQIDPNKKIVIR